MRCQPDRRCSKFGMAIAAHSISTAGFDPLLYVFGADHTLRFVFFSHRSARVYRIAKEEVGSAQILKNPTSLFSPALLSGWAPHRMLLKWLHIVCFVETGAFLDRPSQERAPVPWFLHSHPWSIRDHGSLGIPRLGCDWPVQACLLPLIRLSSTVLISCDTVRRMLGVSTVVQSAEKSKPPPPPPPLKTFEYSSGLSGTVDTWAKGPSSTTPLCGSQGQQNYGYRMITSIIILVRTKPASNFVYLSNDKICWMN